jgi:hypothetical protein
MAKLNFKVNILNDNTNNMIIKTEKKSRKLNELLADHIYDMSQDNLQKFNKIDTGLLANSGEVFHNDKGSFIRYNAPHAKSVEFGRSPGSMPPIEPIQKWAERKGISDKRGKGNRKNVSSVAWAIAQNIKKNGIPPTPFLRSAVTKGKHDLPKLINKIKER